MHTILVKTRINLLFFIENAGKLGYKDCYRFVLFLQWFVHWLYKSSYSPTLLNNRLFMNLITYCLAPVFRTLNTCTCNMFLWCHKMVCLNISLFIYVSVKIFVKYFNTNHAIWLKLTNEILQFTHNYMYRLCVQRRYTI